MYCDFYCKLMWTFFLVSIVHSLHLDLNMHYFKFQNYIGNNVFMFTHTATVWVVDTVLRRRKNHCGIFNCNQYVFSEDKIMWSLMISFKAGCFEQLISELNRQKNKRVSFS